MRVLGVLVCALALAGCQGQAPSPATPPPAPPSGAIRPDTPIPYDTLVQHLTFNTKSRMQLLSLRGRVIRICGPVWRVERDSAGAVLRLGTGQGSWVRAHFARAGDLPEVRQRQEVDIAGTFAFQGKEVILEDAHLHKEEATPAFQQ
jgi:hypothetical protein